MAFWEFLKKTWKFFLGVAITILGGILLSRKNRTGEIIDKSTNHGIDAFDNIIESNELKKDKLEKAELDREKQVEKIRKAYEKKKDVLEEKAREKIERSLEDGDASKATAQLAESLGIKNLD